jgi:hypothetical protein
MKKNIIILFFIFSVDFVFCQIPPIPSIPENCSNGIDDDGDALIDLNDPECFCITNASDFSLIPNSSIELDNCCQADVSQAFCLQNWFQTGAGTTELSEGVYFFVVTVKSQNNDATRYSGPIHLIR